MHVQDLVRRVPELCRVRERSVPCKPFRLVFVCKNLTYRHQDYQLVITEFALQNPAGGQADQ